ncbi:MAG: hypothetical protein GVY18_08115 [Bacteroidetes bacterium]|jgi:hypothetical protein|nr:hypothetical protein [Bacteroidota bacterium]
MSLGIAIKGPEGVVLAADSRVTLSARQSQPDGSILVREFDFDNSQKVLKFSNADHGFVGAVTYGAAIIPNTLRTAHSYFPEIEHELADRARLTVAEYAQVISNFYLDLWEEHAPEDHKGSDMFFIVGGYDEGAPYGSVFLFSIPGSPDPQPRNVDDFGMTWGGQLKIASRLINGVDPEVIPWLVKRFDVNDEDVEQLVGDLKRAFEYRIPYPVLPLQDCVDLAILLIRTTEGIQSRAAVTRGVGGMVDVATITRTAPLQFVQKKSISGERG